MKRHRPQPKLDLSTLKIDGLTLRLVHDADAPYARVIASLPVPDIHGSQEAFYITCSERMHLSQMYERETLARVVRQCALRALSHELDEHLRIDGELVREPHPNGPTTFEPSLEGM